MCRPLWEACVDAQQRRALAIGGERQAIAQVMRLPPAVLLAVEAIRGAYAERFSRLMCIVQDAAYGAAMLGVGVIAVYVAVYAWCFC